MKNINSNNDNTKNVALNASKRFLWVYPLYHLLIIYDGFMIVVLGLVGVGIILTAGELLIGILLFIWDVVFIYLLIQLRKGKKFSLRINIIAAVLLYAFLAIYLG